MYSKKRILVTGAAGFIGSNLCRELLLMGCQVKGLDNLSYGSLKNLEMLEHPASFTFVKGDVLDAALLSELADDVDVIIHLAAMKIPRYGGALDTLNVNSHGFNNVLDAALKANARVVLASTSDVYGKNTELPFSEESNLVLGPSNIGRWSYAASKLFDEHMFFAYRERYSLKGTVLRFFGSYGPNQHLSWWGGPQSVFIAAALKGESMDIHGDGTQTRSFSYVDDTVRGIILSAFSDAADGEIINIGNDEEIAIKDLAALIWRLTGRTGEPLLNFIPYQSFQRKYEDVQRRIPDLSKAKRLLDYSSTVCLSEGLSKTISWQRTRTEGEQ